MLFAALLFWPFNFPDHDLLDDLRWFPDEATAAQMVAFECQRIQWLRGQQAVYCNTDGDAPTGPYADWFQAAIDDCDWRRRAWDELQLAQYEGGIVPVWTYEMEDGSSMVADGQYDMARTHLRQLKDLIGPDAYRMGQMPGPMDWRFTRRAERLAPAVGP